MYTSAWLMIGKNPIIKLNMEVPVKTAKPALPETEQETGSQQWRGGKNQKMNGKKLNYVSMLKSCRPGGDKGGIAEG